MSIAVLDIGKTNAKLALVDAEGTVLAERRMPNEVRPGPPYPHFDVEALWSFAVDALRAFAPRVDAIVPVAHGACAALIAADGSLAAPVLDYEHDGPDAARGNYAPPPFAETGSPPLPGGLNVGAQLHWLEAIGATTGARHLLMWPQYWAWRFCGEMASEATSLGCHTDLWNLDAGAPSTLMRARGWDAWLPLLRQAGDVLGAVSPDLARAAGLDPATPVLCGIHDSNASLLPYLDAAPCGVLSTGTWVIAMALGGTDVILDPGRDTLRNVAADGRPVPTARFMGGRDRDAALAAGQPAADADAAIARHAAARLSEIGARGPTHVEGPFAVSEAFLDALRDGTGRPVRTRHGRAGTLRGAASLAAGRTLRRP